MIYLASPYSHPHPVIMQTRFEQTCRAIGALINQGLMVFSPIVHCHPVADFCKLPTDFDFWESYNYHFLERSEKMIVLKISGWDSSIGVRGEAAKALELGIPVEYMEVSDV